VKTEDVIKVSNMSDVKGEEEEFEDGWDRIDIMDQ